jgi:hypothetical protein
MKIEEVDIHNWMPEWAKKKYYNCPIFRRVMMEANRQRLNREQTLWMLCEVLYTDRDIWKGEALDLARTKPLSPMMVKIADLEKFPNDNDSLRSPI